MSSPLKPELCVGGAAGHAAEFNIERARWEMDLSSLLVARIERQKQRR
jgi:hypothetical protein